MHLVLRKAVLSDADALTDIYFSAFSNDAISLLVFPRDPESRKWWYDSVVEEMGDPNAHFMCIIDTESPDQKVVAYSKWNGSDAPFPDGSNPIKWPANSDSELADHFFGNLLSRHAKMMRGRKHWYLELLATRKEYQGRGAASQLLKWGLAQSDAAGTETYLEASPEGKPVYERFGFEEEDRLIVDLKGKSGGVLDEQEFVEVFMVRSIPLKSA